MGHKRDIHAADFDEGDFKTLKIIVESRGDLFTAALACKLVCERCRFPIESADDLLDAVLAGPGSQANLAGHIITFEEAQSFLTPDLFPIEDEVELATRLLLALDRQTTLTEARSVIESFQSLTNAARARKGQHA